MADPPAWVWLTQVDSDWDAARRILVKRQPKTYCQAVARYQQVVEKSICALVAALNEKGMIRVKFKYTHDVEKYFSAMVRRGRSGQPQDIQDRIGALLNESRRGEIRAITALAPKRPAPGELHRRNTEYPFQLNEVTWKAPAEEGSFDFIADVERFRDLAWRIYDGVSRIVSAIQRTPI